MTSQCVYLMEDIGDDLVVCMGFDALTDDRVALGCSCLQVNEVVLQQYNYTQ